MVILLGEASTVQPNLIKRNADLHCDAMSVTGDCMDTHLVRSGLI